VSHYIIGKLLVISGYFFVLSRPWLMQPLWCYTVWLQLPAKLWLHQSLLPNPFSLALLNAFCGIYFMFWVNFFAFKCVYIVPLACAHTLGVCSCGTASVGMLTCVFQSIYEWC